MAPLAPTTCPATSTSSRAPVSTMELEATGGGAFKVDGWAEAPNFFLGAMVDGDVGDEDGEEDDALRTPLGSRK